MTDAHDSDTVFALAERMRSAAEYAFKNDLATTAAHSDAARPKNVIALVDALLFLRERVAALDVGHHEKTDRIRSVTDDDTRLCLAIHSGQTARALFMLRDRVHANEERTASIEARTAPTAASTAVPAPATAPIGRSGWRCTRAPACSWSSTDVKRPDHQCPLCAAPVRAAYFTPSTPNCHSCGRPVEEQRRCYAVPTCYGCLPPPPPLGVIDVPRAAPDVAGLAKRMRGSAVLAMANIAADPRYAGILAGCLTPEQYEHAADSCPANVIVLADEADRLLREVEQATIARDEWRARWRVDFDRAEAATAALAAVTTERDALKCRDDERVERDLAREKNFTDSASRWQEQIAAVEVERDRLASGLASMRTGYVAQSQMISANVRREDALRDELASARKRLADAEGARREIARLTAEIEAASVAAFERLHDHFGKNYYDEYEVDLGIIRAALASGAKP